MQELLIQIELLAIADGFDYFGHPVANDTDDPSDDDVNVFITTDRPVEGGGRWAAKFLVPIASASAENLQEEAKRLYSAGLADMPAMAS